MRIFPLDLTTKTDELKKLIDSTFSKGCSKN